MALAETGFTFTTAINSRADPELAAEIHSEVALPRDLWLRAQSKLNAVDAEIQDFQTMVGQAAFSHLNETIRDLRRTFSAWAEPETETEQRPVEAVVQPFKEPEYTIHLWSKGIQANMAPHGTTAGSRVRLTAMRFGARRFPPNRRNTFTRFA